MPLNPTANFTGPFRFFDLPHELRDIVYDYTWSATSNLKKRCKSYRGGVVHISVKHRNTARTSFLQTTWPEWSILSKQLLREAADQLFRNCRWKAKVLATSLTTSFALRDETHYGVGPTTTEMLLEELCHGFDPGREPRVDWIAVSVGRDESRPTEVSQLKKLDASLRNNAGHKALYVSFGVLMVFIDDETRVDLSGLEGTGFQLDKLVVDVHGVCNDSYKKMADALRPVLQDEIIRLGGVLVGKDARMLFERKSAVRRNRNAAYVLFEYWCFQIQKV